MIEEIAVKQAALNMNSNAIKKEVEKLSCKLSKEAVSLGDSFGN